MTHLEILAMVAPNMNGMPYSPHSIRLYYRGLECALRFDYLAKLQADPTCAYAEPVGSLVRRKAARVMAKRDMQHIRVRE